jgi:hypothetical protein
VALRVGCGVAERVGSEDGECVKLAFNVNSGVGEVITLPHAARDISAMSSPARIAAAEKRSLDDG